MSATDMMPDLSHLTEEERKIIEEVLQRQKAEENKEQQIQQQYDKELEEIERQINERKENAMRLIGTQDDAICQICQKTKFADGIGHKCYYCQLRSCARCGGRMQIKVKADQGKTPAGQSSKSQPQKTIWACSLCQKRQQILGKTGKWFHKDTGMGGAGGSRATTPTALSPSGTPTPTMSAPTSVTTTPSQRVTSNGAPGSMPPTKQQPFTLQQPQPPSQQQQHQSERSTTVPNQAHPIDRHQQPPPTSPSPQPGPPPHRDRRHPPHDRQPSTQSPRSKQDVDRRRPSIETEREDRRREEQTRSVSPGPSVSSDRRRLSQHHPAQPSPSPVMDEPTLADDRRRRRPSEVREYRHSTDHASTPPSSVSGEHQDPGRSSRERWPSPTDQRRDSRVCMDDRRSRDEHQPQMPPKMDSRSGTPRRSPPRHQSVSPQRAPPARSYRDEDKGYNEEPTSPHYETSRSPPEYRSYRRGSRDRAEEEERERARRRDTDRELEYGGHREMEKQTRPGEERRRVVGASEVDTFDSRGPPAPPDSRHRLDEYYDQDSRTLPPEQKLDRRRETSGRSSPNRQREYIEEHYEDEQRYGTMPPVDQQTGRSRDTSQGVRRTLSGQRRTQVEADSIPPQEEHIPHSHRKVLPVVATEDDEIRAPGYRAPVHHRQHHEQKSHERRRLPEPEEVLRAGAASSQQRAGALPPASNAAPRPVRQSPHSRRNLEAVASAYRQDSLSSDPEIMHKPTPVGISRTSPTNTRFQGDRQHHHHHSKSHYGVPSGTAAKPSHSHRAVRLSHQKPRSFSSSDEEVASTSECPSCDEMESETYSDRGGRALSARDRCNIHFSAAAAVGAPSAADFELVAANRQLSVTWQPSADGQRLVGHMILRRPAGASLGFKVVGGRPTPSGRLGAFVTKVKRGSVAEVVGHLKPGDEVLEWNGRELQNASFDEVCDVINESKHDPQVELIVSRAVGSIPWEYGTKGASAQYLTSVLGSGGTLQYEPVNDMVSRADSLSLHKQVHVTTSPGTGTIVTVQPSSVGPASATYVPGQTPVVMITAPSVSAAEPVVVVPSPGSAVRAGDLMQHQARGQIFGRIQIALFYSPADQQLVITVYQATDLPPRNDGNARNPYVKMFLLPDRSEKSRRQTKTLAGTCQPTWQQSFIYQNVTQMDLSTRVLEVTLWDYDKYASNEFLGEVLFDLASTLLDNEPRWYTLTDMDEESPIRLKLRQLRLSAYTSQQAYSSAAAPDQRIRADSSSAYPGASSAHQAATGILHAGTDPLGEDLQQGRRSSLGYRTDPRVAFVDQQSSEQTGGITRSQTYHRPRHPEAVNQDELDDAYSGYYSDHGHRSRALRRPPRAPGVPGTKGLPTTGEEEGDVEYDQDGNPIAGSRRHLPRVPADIYGEEAMRELGDKAQQIRAQGMGQRRHHSARTHRPYPHGVVGTNSHRRHHQQRMHYDPMSPPNEQNLPGYLSDGSETSMSITSTQSERPRTRTHQEFQNSLEAAPEETEPYDGQDGTMSDSAVGVAGGPSNKAVGFAADAKRKKSIMTRLIPGRAGSALTLADQKRMGFRRSDEVGVPANLSPLSGSGEYLVKQTSRESTDSNDSAWVPLVPGDGPLGEFIAGLGPGQVVGRQALASPCLGEIQLTISHKSGNLEVKVVRARNLVKKPGAKYNPAPYVKVYLVEGKYCVAKAKTTVAARTAEPRFDQHLVFNETYRGRLLQVSVWGDYGRMERKAFMGIALIRLDNLEQSPRMEGWYKLYHSSSLVGTSSPGRKESQPLYGVDGPGGPGGAGGAGGGGAGTGGI